MLKSLATFFTAPAFSDEDATRRARLLSFLINLHLSVAFGTAFALAAFTDMRPVFPLGAFISGLPGLGLRILMQRGQVTLASVLFVGMIFLIMPGIAWAGDSSVASAPVTVFQTITIVMAGLLLGGPGAAIFVALTVLVNGALVYAELNTGFATDRIYNPVNYWLMQGIAFSAIAVMLGVTNRSIRESFARARRENEERRQAEEKLRYLELLYRLAIDAAGAVPYYRNFSANRYSYMGEGILQMTGYSAAEMTPDLWERLELERYPRGRLAGLTYEEADALIESRNDITWECDYLIRTRDGQTRWVADTAVVGLDSSGEQSGVVGILQDITERKLAEQKMAQTARQLSSINEIGRAVMELNDLNTVLEIIRVQLARVIAFDVYSVRLFNADSRTVTHLAVYESGRYWTEPDTPLTPGTDACKVFETGKSILNLLTEAELEDCRSTPHPRIGDHSRSAASLIFVPLKKHGQTIGALSVQRYAMNAYTQEHLELVEAVAIQVGIAIENARLFTHLQKELAERTEAEALTVKVNFELQRRIQELYVLNAMAQAGASVKNEDDLLEAVVETLHNSLYPDIVGVALWDADAGLLRTHPRAHRGVPAHMGQFSSPLGEGVVGIAAASRKPYRIRDVDDPNYRPLDPTIRSELCVPILAGDRLLGVLNAESRQPDAFSDADENLMFTLAGQLASAMERLRAEQQLRAINSQLEHRVIQRTAELERANRELEAFSYSVSHDLRAPLRGINSYTRIIKDEFSTRIDPEALGFLDKVIAASLRMTRLIDNLLEFSRTSRQPLAKQPVDMRAIARQIIEALSPEMESRQIEWTVTDLPPAQADPALMQQVYANLIGNAVKYTRKRSQARIEVGHFMRDGGRVYFVRDNGAGFDMQYAEKLFGVFQRLHREDEFEGTGIGLAIVQRIVERHGGRIWAEAEADEGATFFFTLE